MCRITSELKDLTRPAILVDAARHAAEGYRRRRDLRRMLRTAIPATARAALVQLLPIEAALERRRREGDSLYSPARHVDILCAVMAEARDFRVT
jgi:hypothetical protein